MLGQSIRKDQNRAIEAAAVIQELIELSRQMREAGKRGEQKNSVWSLRLFAAIESVLQSCNVLFF